MNEFESDNKYKIQELEFVTFGTVEYQWLLWPLSLLLWKYWDAPLNIIYFSDKRTKVEELPPNVKFKLVSENKKISENWNWATDFGIGVSSALEQLNDDIVFITLMDMWPTNPIKLNRIDCLIEYIKNRKDVLRIGISDDSNHLSFGRVLEKWLGLDIVITTLHDRDVGGLRGYMLTPSLWNRKMLLHTLENCSIWDFEEKHTEYLRKDLSYFNFHSVWTRQSIYPFYHTMSRADVGKKIFLLGFSDEDKKIIKGYIPKNVEIIE